MYQTSLNHNIAPKQYHNNRLYVRHHRSRPLRCRYSSETTPRGGENDDAIRITSASDWEDYQATDLIRLANDGEEEGEEEGEKYYFEIVEKIDNSGDVSFIGYIDGIEYQLNVSKTAKEARLHTRGGGGGGGREERRKFFVFFRAGRAPRFLSRV